MKMRPVWYDVSYRRRMDAFDEGLWTRLDTVPTLQPETRDAVVRYLLELACQSQHVRNIVLGRTALLSLPRQWIIDHIEPYAEPLLRLEDEWEYSRLGELYEQLDEGLVLRLIARGSSSHDDEIRVAAQDF